jgi:Holliday junction DNA helicase RuvA
MIDHLRGTIARQHPGEVTVDVHGVGYRVFVPLDVWEKAEEGAEQTLWTSTYVREDRLDLFGFLDHAGRALFEELLAISGIGPKMALELCSVPRGLLAQAVHEEDAGILTSIKGIGKKTAEKLLLELKNLAEKHPEILRSATGETRGRMDPDAVAALEALGYDSSTIMHALKALPKDLGTTEERVAAALRSL